MTYANVYGLDLTTWRPARALWLELAQQHRQFGLSGTPQGFSKFIRRRGDEMHAAGVVVRMQNGTWLGHPLGFPPAVITLKTGGKLAPLKSRRKGKRRKRARAKPRPGRPAAELSV
jgi:hypothetical protein